MPLLKTIAQRRMIPHVHNKIYLCLFPQKMIVLLGYKSSLDNNLVALLKNPLTVMKILQVAKRILMKTLSFCRFHN